MARCWWLWATSVAAGFWAWGCAPPPAHAPAGTARSHVQGVPRRGRHVAAAESGLSGEAPARYRARLVARRPGGFRERILALTFDDGPSPTVTPRVLDLLARYHAHATFFVLGGQAARYPGLVRREAAEGHAVGSHSYTHPASTSSGQAAAELDRTSAAIRAATGHAPTLFRPPYGITRGTLARTALARGYTVVTWTLSSADTTKAPPRVLADNVIHTPAPGDIVLMHDGAGHERTAQALAMVLDELSRAGCRFVTLPELLRAWDRRDRGR